MIIIILDLILLLTDESGKIILDFMPYYVVYYNRRIYNNPVAQLVEQHPFKVMVIGSSPIRITS